MNWQDLGYTPVAVMKNDGKEYKRIGTLPATFNSFEEYYQLLKPIQYVR